jgi:hypothetical protein
MRLARAVKPGKSTHPIGRRGRARRGRLRRAASARAVFTVGHEGLKLTGERIGCGPAFWREHDLRNSLIGNALLFGICLENVAVEHRRLAPCFIAGLCGDRRGAVVPTVPLITPLKNTSSPRSMAGAARLIRVDMRIKPKSAPPVPPTQFPHFLAGTPRVPARREAQASAALRRLSATGESSPLLQDVLIQNQRLQTLGGGLRLGLGSRRAAGSCGPLSGKPAAGDGKTRVGDDG